MISSAEEYYEAMREIIRKVQDGYQPPFDASDEEQEIFADCIRNGYLNGHTTYRNKNGVEYELRTQDGKMHAELINHVIPPKGLAFLNGGPEDAPQSRVIEELKRLNDNICEKSAGDKAEKAKDRKFQIVNSLVSAAVGALLTFCAAHSSEIFHYMQSFH